VSFYGKVILVADCHRSLDSAELGITGRPLTADATVPWEERIASTSVLPILREPQTLTASSQTRLQTGTA
jgi:hypothetical protein